MQHLSGRILKPSMECLFGTEYTSSLAVIPASHSRSPASEKESPTPDTFGLILKESLRQLDLFTDFSKMSPDTLPLDSQPFTEAYEIWVTRLRWDCLLRQSAARLTAGSDCLSWRTPVEQPAAIKVDKLTGELGKRMYHKETGRLAQYGLDQQVNWPTPQHSEHKGQSQRGQHRPDDRLTNKVLSGLPDQDSPNTNGKSQGLWRSPSVPNGGRQRKAKVRESGKRSLELNEQLKGKLNPDWVESLMGLPTHWTLIED